MNARSAITPSIAGNFVLIAVATLYHGGHARGEIEFVIFYATDGCAKHKWSAVYSKAFVNGIISLVGNSTAEEILFRLRRAEPVVFPGTFTLDEIRSFGRLKKAG